MLFTEGSFFIFLAVVFALYYFPPFARFQIAVLIASSLIFYAFDRPYLLILLLTSCIISSTSSYLVAQLVDKKRRLAICSLGVILNLSILALFKYGKLILVEEPSDFVHTLLTLPLPIGISFYTFHGISLLVDVLRGTYQVAEKTTFHRHLSRTILYLTYFPQLIAGPIVKARDFFPQIESKKLSQIDWSLAMRQLAVGYFLKLVIANNLHDQTYYIGYPHNINVSSWNLLVYLIGYSMQIFADFAGYSLIALGISTIFGYRLPSNFLFPYIASSFSEFWRRWHISLSSWLRDYLYVPLGGNQQGHCRTYLNLLVVMFLGGLWHGAAWSYAIWGLLHGIALAVERPFLGAVFYRSENWMVILLRRLMVFSVVTAGWLLFKLPDFSHLTGFFAVVIKNSGMAFKFADALPVLVYTLPILIYHGAYLLRKRREKYLSPPIYVYGFLLALIFLNSGKDSVFIYFQF